MPCPKSREATLILCIVQSWANTLLLDRSMSIYNVSYMGALSTRSTCAQLWYSPMCQVTWCNYHKLYIVPCAKLHAASSTHIHLKTMPWAKSQGVLIIHLFNPGVVGQTSRCTNLPLSYISNFAHQNSSQI